MSLDLTKQRLKSAKNRIDTHIDQNIMLWATETILLPGQTDIANSVSQRAADALSLEKSGFMKVDLKWDFRSEEGAPIHFFLEYGTKQPAVRFPRAVSPAVGNCYVIKIFVFFNHFNPLIRCNKKTD